MTALLFRPSLNRRQLWLGLVGTVLALTMVVSYPASRADASFTSNPSPSATATLTSATLAPATGLSDSILLTTVNLTWTASTSSFATGYDVLRNSGSGYVLLATVTGTTYADVVSLTGGTYYYVVQAVDDLWTSGDSNVVTVTCTLSLCS
ncbi:MAG: hypothetical protein ACYCS7_15310 [Acidimicrobiales bacterium]